MAIAVVEVAPYLDTLFGKCTLLGITAEVLEYHYGLGIHGLDGVMVLGEHVDTTLVVVRCGGLGTFALGEALGEVEAETIEAVLTEQVLEVALHMLAHLGVLVVPVVEHAVGVGGCDVEPRVVRCGTVAGSVPIELGHGVCTGGVVVYHIEEHCDATAVTLVDELLVHLACAVGLVHGKVGAGVVAPAVVAVELLHRHQLDGVDAQRLQVVEAGKCPLQVLGGGEVA